MQANWHNIKQTLSENKNKLVVTVIFVAVILNFVTFAYAYPAAFVLPEDAVYARDFSAYYIGGWRLFNNPTQVYSGLPQPGDYQINPSAQTFKYTPSFLVIFAPFLTLSYENALGAFILLEAVLIPALAFFIFKLVKNKNVILASAVAIIVLVNPLPSLQWDNTVTFTPSYYLGYMLGNAHVLQAILLVAALYLGYTKKPWLSALLFTFGALDPRPAMLAIPLLLWYNRPKLKQFIIGTAAFLTLFNLPFFFYHDVGFHFLREVMSFDIVSQWYAYDWIPIYSVLALTGMEITTFLSSRRKVSIELNEDHGSTI